MTKALLIHGMLADQRVWRSVARELGTEYAFAELPSHGAAPDWNGGDYQTQAFELALSKCDAPVHLIGHSFGATVALRLAVERPELLTSLTLIEPVFFYAVRQAFPAEYEAYCSRAEPVSDAFRRQDLIEAAMHFLGVWGVEGAWHAMPDPARAAIARKMALVEASAPSLLDDSGTIWPRLDRIECPVMLVTGGQSEEVMTSIHLALETRLNVTTSLKIDEAGHMIPATHGSYLGQQIAQFLG